MSISRIAAIIIIFLIACMGWTILGTATALRSASSYHRLGAHVTSLWGNALLQKAPVFSVKIPGSRQIRHLSPVDNRIRVTINKEDRKKGLMWYPTYSCTFDGSYVIENTEVVAQKIRLHYDFPDPEGTYDNFRIAVDDHPLELPIHTREGVGILMELAPNQKKKFQVSYNTRGIYQWSYLPAPVTGRVKQWDMKVNTNFMEVDYDPGGLSPMKAENTDEGMALTWMATDLITEAPVGIIIPEKLNPGPVTTRITYFAPVGLIFFFVLIATIQIMYKLNIHPMHYLFVASGFFAFHLLLAYLVGLVDIHIAFILSGTVSVGLVTSYLSSTLGKRFPWKLAVGGQFLFLILFSYSFFFKGITGLTIAIGSVITLAVLMKVTAHLEWSEVFKRRKRKKIAAETESETMKTAPQG